MYCKHCGKQMDEDAKVCPGCGAETTQKKADKELVSPWKLILATALCVVLLVVLSVVVINSITGRNWPFDLIPKNTTAATEATVANTEAPLGTAEDLGLALPGVVDIPVYTDDAAAKEKGSEVIAQYGDYQLTNKLLQVFYWTEYGNFVVSAVNNGEDLAAGYNLDIYTNMSQQKLPGYDVTWEQYFLHQALQTWFKYAVVNVLADEAGFELDAETLNSLSEASATLAADAAEDGYADVEALIDDRLGTSCDLEDYIHYMTFTARADGYYTKFISEYEPTDQEVEEFFDLNAEYYSYYYGLSKNEYGAGAVRHVLVQPEGCEFDDYNYVVATDEQWEACRVAAQAMLDAWVADGASEEAFAELANANSKDSGSNTTGGLYSAVVKDRMVANFDAWVFDESRKAGDYGLVKTEYGYHLIYFISMTEEPAWYAQARTDTINYGYGFNTEVNNRMNANVPAFELAKVVLSDVAEQKPAETTTTEPTTAATEAAQ